MAAVTIYEHANFQGHSQVLTEGQYDDALNQLTIGNDTLSSLQVPQGLAARLYEHFHFQGQFIDIKEDTPAISQSWNDRTSSIIVYKDTEPSPIIKTALIFEHANYGGRFQLLQPGKYDVARLLIGNDTLSSALVPSSLVLRLYEHANFQGAFIEIRVDTPAVSMDWNDRVSSIIVYEAAMALSLDTIYRPFNEFFSNKFAAGEGARVTFRFAHLPRVFNDSDFLAPLHPEWGPSPAIAQELLSTAVDGVPHLDDDGRTVWLNTARLSDLYHDEIVGPAIPFVPAEVTAETDKQARIDAFTTAKADAIGRWEKIKAVSLIEGAGVEFRPSTAAPEKWWDKNDSGVWIHQSFQVKGAASVPGQTPHPVDKLLRMKIDDTVFRSVLQSHVQMQASLPSTSAGGRPQVMLNRPILMKAQPAFSAALAADAAGAGSPRLVTPALRRAIMLEQPPSTGAMLKEAPPKMSAFPFRQRLEIQAELATNAPTQSVVTSDVTISFDYCIVTVSRPWLHEAFLHNLSWRIPGQGKGQLSANDGHGLPALPVGFVIVKNLSIQAPWTPEDIANLEQSVQFGPFNFDSKVVNGAITHEGLQIVGWLLQDLPDLPPNTAPGA